MESKRVLAFIIDFIVTAIIQNFLFMYFIIFPLIKKISTDSNGVFIKALVLTYISICYLILRDLPKTGSLGKNIMKLKIISTNTKSDANILNRILRNAPWIFGPIKIIVYLFTGKRLGDRIAKTKVIQK